MSKNNKKVKSVEKKVKSTDKKQNKFTIDSIKDYFDSDLFKKLLPVILIIFVMSFAFNIRDGPSDLEGINERVQSNTYGQIQSIITQDINSQYSNLNQLYKEELISEKFSEAVELGYYETSFGERIDIAQIVERNSKNLKDSFKADNGQTYLLAIDPYHFLRLSENVVENGHAGDELKETNDGKVLPFLNYKVAPEGSFIKSKFPEFHVWLESALFKIKGYDSTTDIGDKTRIIYFIPVIFVMLSVIPIFLILRTLSNDLFALFGSLLLVSIGTFVSRTIAGFVDTDAYTVFFPLVIVALIYYSFRSKTYLLTGIYATLAGLAQGMFLWAWPPGWFIFVFMIFSVLGYLGYSFLVDLIREKKFDLSLVKGQLLNFLIVVAFSISSFIFVYLLTAKNIFTLSYGSIFGSISSIAGISTSSIWPNVLSSVAELNPASFNQVVGSVGGKIIFLIALMGVLMLALDYKRKYESFKTYSRVLIGVTLLFYILIVENGFLVNLTANSSFLFMSLLFLPIGIGILFSLINEAKSEKTFMAILLSAWIAGTIYMSFNGVRFILLLAPAFSIAFGLGLYYISKTINTTIGNEFKTKSNLKKYLAGFLVSSVLFVVLFAPLATSASNISKNSFPNFDDSWYGTMDKIRENSSEDAIITSWWDFGHFFTAVAHRGVTFDGGSQGLPQAHWVGKLLLESDEKVSHDILRMIVCGGNQAFDYMYEVSNDNTNGVKTNKLIYNTFGKTYEEKLSLLRNYKYHNFSEEEIETTMSFLYCEEPRENFLITSQDMIGKAGVWAHWGSWDFTRKYVHDNYKVDSVEKISNDLDENQTLIENYVEQLETIDLRAATEDVKRSDLLNGWFAPYPSYIAIEGRYFHSCESSNTSFVCLNGAILIDKITGQVSTSEQAPLNIGRFIFPSIERGLDVVDQGNNGDLDLLLIQTQNGPQVMLVQRPLGTSLFTQLYYLDGTNSKYFESFHDVQSVTGVRVRTWKVNWESVK